MRTLIRSLVALVASFISFSEVWAETQQHPNILILYADDFGYGDLACQNPNSKIPTPTLDELASQGIRFTDGHSSSGICTPSRYALLTGRYHWREFHNIVGIFGGSKFAADRLTMPEMLQQRSYHTAAIGKWHLGWDWDAVRNHELKPMNAETKPCYGPNHFDWSKPIPDGPLAHGFDYYFGDDVINFPPFCWIENDRVTEPPTVMANSENWKPLREGNWETRPGPMVQGWDPYKRLPTITERAAEYCRQLKETKKPFFLYVAFPSPHAPIVPAEEFNDTSEAGAYGDYVVQTDDACRQILEAIESTGKSDNTLVIFTSDNGPERYAYERDRKFQHWSSAPLRGLKRDIYEGGHRVPFLVRWPGVIKPESVSSALVSQIDIMATLAEMLDFEIPNGQAEDSQSFLSVLTGKAASARSEHVHNTYAKKYALRYGQWLLIDHKDGYSKGKNTEWEQRHSYPEDDNQKTELYDLSKDLEQKVNLAQRFPERVEAMQERLAQIRANSDH
ncbi:MAG: arylsulfatase [Lacipirellulaceae bacterium]